MNRFILVAGARPNFMKIAPVSRALAARDASTFLVHTGQHYDTNMSDVFFAELGISRPDLHLGVGSGDRITQTRKIKQALVPVLLEQKPDAIIVVGDVTSTAAGTMAGVMAGIPVVHVEAGLRSFNWTMPEELNRMIADHHSDLLFIHEESALKNLLDEGIARDRIHEVGNVMIDTLLALLPKSRNSSLLGSLGFAPQSYGLVTLHRPDNVDHPEHLREVVGALADVAARIPLVLPLHPRTKQRLETFGVAVPPSIRVIDPIGYLDMLALTSNA
jgi:UDP-N-acetylglucosamine 2-epimerase (non-hydrolysing)